jgi:hypothetical protein
MQTPNAIEPAAAARAPIAQPAWHFIRRALGGPRGLLILGIALIAGGLALGWGWLTAVGLAPIILALAPCAAMCAIGACAMSRGGANPASQTMPETAAPMRPNGSQSCAND